MLNIESATPKRQELRTKLKFSRFDKNIYKLQFWGTGLGDSVLGKIELSLTNKEPGKTENLKIIHTS